MTTTQDSPSAGIAGPSDEDAPGHNQATTAGADTGNAAEQKSPDPYRLDPAREARAQRIFDQQLTALADAEHQKSLLAHHEITALVTAHRHAYALLPAGTRPGAPRPHALGSTDRGDTWLHARELVLSEYAPACALSMRTAGHRLDQALDASQYYPDTLTALTDPDSGITPQKLSILLRETRHLTVAQKRAVEAIVLPHASEDTSTGWARRIREAIVAVLGAPLAAQVRRRREQDRYVAIIPDGMIAQLLGELPLAQARALDLALDALAETADSDDPRTHAQRRIDALLACVLGPAVFLTRPTGKNHRGSGHNECGRDSVATGSRSDRAAGAPTSPSDGNGHDRDHADLPANDASAWPEPVDEDEPIPDYGHGQPDQRDIGGRERAHRLIFKYFDRPRQNTAPDTGPNSSDSKHLADDADGSTTTGAIDGTPGTNQHDSNDRDENDTRTDNDERNPYRDLPLPIFADWDEPQPDPHAPDNTGDDPLARALWDTDEGVLPLIDPDQSVRVTELWDLIRQLAARINLTIPTPPVVNLDVTIPIDLLAGSDRAHYRAGPSSDERLGDAGQPPSDGNGGRPSDPRNQGTDRDGTTDIGSDLPCPGTRMPGWRVSDSFDTRHSAIIDGIGPVDPDLARHLATDARWRRVLADPVTGIVYDVGKTRYRIPADMRRRVITRDMTCRFPGCARKARYCHLDHVIEYPDGPTADCNLIALCELHHRVKHQTGWQLVLHEDASIDWISPTGRRYTTYPANRKAPPRDKTRKKGI